MTAVRNTFEGGTNGTAISAGNSGGSSGTAFASVNKGTGAVVSYDTAHPALGALSAKISVGATSTVANMELALPSTTTTIAFSFYLYTATLGDATGLDLVAVRSSGTNRLFIRVNAGTGMVTVIDSLGNNVGSMSTVIPQGLVRFDVTATLSSTVGQATVNQYNTATSSTPDDTITTAANKNFGGSADNIRYGINNNTTNKGPVWIDSIRHNDTGTAYGSPDLVTISLTRVFNWNVLASVSLTRVFKWNVLAAISLTRVFKWNVRASVSLTRIFKWNVRATLTTTRIFKWNVKATITTSRIFKWNVRAVLTTTRTFKWNVKLGISFTRTFLWLVFDGWHKIPENSDTWTPINENGASWTHELVNSSTWE